MIDMNSLDSPHNAPQFVENDNIDKINRDELEYYNDTIKNQYIELINIGTNLLKNINNNYKIFIFEEMIEYCNDNYLNIITIDDNQISPIQTLENGAKIYEFLCIDCLNTIIPSYMNTINCINYEQFNLYFKKILKNDISNFKTSIIKVISSILDELLKLQKLDINVLKDKEYNKTLNKCYYYIELLNYGDLSNFLENYFQKILIKYEDEIQWRLS